MIDFSTQEGETLGDRIRNLRIIHGMSQDDLAKAVGENGTYRKNG